MNDSRQNLKQAVEGLVTSICLVAVRRDNSRHADWNDDPPDRQAINGSSTNRVKEFAQNQILLFVGFRRATTVYPSALLHAHRSGACHGR